jgi:hypothetical protein
MLEILKDIATSLALAGVLAVGVWLLKTRKQQLIITLNNLIQMAEEGIKGSGLGETKKAWVIAQLEIIGVKVTDTVSALIDELVDIMNKKQTSLTDAVASTATGAIDEVTKTVTKSE